MKHTARIWGTLTALAVVLLALTGHAGGQGAPEANVAMVALDGEAANYWPRWRGPSGQGVGPDGDYPDTWSDTKNVLWKVTLPGRGNSSPIVWGDFLFLSTAYDQGKRRSILCLSRKDGKRIWETF